ncbi:hypothetical protein GBA52_005400, partial [Prunus armeniaca]
RESSTKASVKITGGSHDQVDAEVRVKDSCASLWATLLAILAICIMEVLGKSARIALQSSTKEPIEEVSTVVRLNDWTSSKASHSTCK